MAVSAADHHEKTQHNNKVISLAAYLPQFHPIPENDQWWGPGFTEWTHLRNAKTWHKTHTIRRPHPSLGEYSLLNPNVLETQFATASTYGITGFAVWHYWLGNGKRLLETPLNLALKHNLAFNYCLAWANHPWLNKAKNTLLAPQLYLGAADYRRFFHSALPHLTSPHYITINSRPIFIIFDPSAIPDLPTFIDTWREESHRTGLPTPYLIGDRLTPTHPSAHHFDKVSNVFSFWTPTKNWTARQNLPADYLRKKLYPKLGLQPPPTIYDYWAMVHDATPPNAPPNYMPTALAGWDTTPRHNNRGVIFKNYNPENFVRHLQTIKTFLQRDDIEEKLVFVKSWNEWAEQNTLEPDSTYGFEFLERYKTILGPNPAAP